MISITIDGHVTRWDRGAERLYGFLSQERVGRSLWESADWAHPSLQRALEAVLGGAPTRSCRVVRRHKSGRLVPVEVRLSGVLDPFANGRVIGVVDVSFAVAAERSWAMPAPVGVS